MTTSGRLGLGLLAIAAGIGLSWIEDSPALLALGLPPLLLVAFASEHPSRVSLALRWTLSIATLVPASWAVQSWTGQRLVDHAFVVTDRLRLAQDTHDWVTDHPCARFQYRPGMLDDQQHPRDALGRSVADLEGDDPLDILIVGDSVLDFGFSEQLTRLLRRNGIGAHIVNASMFNYDWNDYRCRIEEDLEAHRPDLIVVGLCLNDLPLPRTIDADLGRGVHRYALRFGTTDPNPVHPNLLVDRAHPFLRQGGLDDWAARWPDALVTDVADASLFDDVLDRVRQDPKLQQKLSALVESTGDVPTVFVALPLLYTPKPSPLDPFVSWELDALEALGATTLDLRPLVRASGPTTLAFGTDPPPVTAYDVLHLNAHGQDRLAEAVLDAARTLGVWSHERLGVPAPPTPGAPEACGHATITPDPDHESGFLAVCAGAADPSADPG